jgi:hypothetical protein
MVKGVATSISTVAVLMGSVVACGGSDSEVAELREELEEIKAQLPEQETTAVETASSQPIPKPDQIPFGSDRDASEYLKELADDADIIVGLIGKQIAFHSDELNPFSNRDGDFEIFVMDADGSNVISTTQKGGNPTFKP